MPTISPAAGKRLLDEGAHLIDIRSTGEHARERIGGARNLPLEQVGVLEAGDTPVVFHWKSGNRTKVHVDRLAAAASGCDAYVVAGGIEAWKTVGLPVAVDRHDTVRIDY